MIVFFSLHVILNLEFHFESTSRWLYYFIHKKYFNPYLNKYAVLIGGIMGHSLCNGRSSWYWQCPLQFNLSRDQGRLQKSYLSCAAVSSFKVYCLLQTLHDEILYFTCLLQSLHIALVPVRIRVRIDPSHPFVCFKRPLNGAVLRIRSEKSRPCVTAGVAR
jgi:hypothetical protein